MPARITKAGERLIAQKQAADEVLLVTRFVLALVPDLDPEQPIDRDAPKPPPEQIVHTQTFTQKGFVNPNQVVYSLMMGSDIGDFDWNWIGLEAADGVLLSVAYVPLQQKRRNIPPHQIGNNVTRNMLLMFDGAQVLTDVTIDASTWQHDFTVRLQDIDERERLSNRDVFGRACFFGDGLQLVSAEDGYQLRPGLAFVEGLRIELGDIRPVIPPKYPTNAYLDVAWVRHENSVAVQWSVAWGQTLSDRQDPAGIAHYLIPLAHLPDSATVTDLRAVEPIGGALVQHFAARNGDYKGLRARATTKEDVGLDQLPNAKSDDPASDSSDILATTKALNKLNHQIGDPLVGMVASFAMSTAPTGWLKCNGEAVSRKTFAKLFAAIGTDYGAGDGATTFTLPDMRGLFPRAWSDGAETDPQRALGSVQQDQNAAHVHTATADKSGEHSHPVAIGENGDHLHAASSEAAGAHQHGLLKAAAGNNTAGPYVSPANAGNSLAYTESAGSHVHTIAVGAAGNHTHAASIGAQAAHTHGITVATSGGTEARPINMALLFCIKY